MKIAQHSDALPIQPPVQSTGNRANQAAQTGNVFASLVAGSAADSDSTSSTSSASGSATNSAAGNSTGANVWNDPALAWVTCGLPASGAATSAATAGTAAAETTQAASAAGAVTSTQAATAASDSTAATAAAVTAQPGIGALIAAIQNGSFQPTYINSSQLGENTQFGTIDDSSAYYASDQTAQQLATLLGGTVVKQVPFASSTATTTEPLANFIQLPSGQTVNAGDLSYYAKFSGYGTQQLAADLTQEINQGGAITSYSDQMLSFLSGTGTHPGDMPTFQPNVIGPAIAGMTYPPGTLNPDGSVINPNAVTTVAT